MTLPTFLLADTGRSAGVWRMAARRAEGALKQCGAARPPAVEPVRDLHEVLRRDRRATVDGAPARGGPDVLLSREACRTAGYRLARLGERVLRFETAAMTALAVAGDHLRSLTDDDREDRDG